MGSKVEMQQLNRGKVRESEGQLMENHRAYDFHFLSHALLTMAASEDEVALCKIHPLPSAQ